MNSQTLRRIGIAGIILTILVGLDGLYMTITNYKPDDAGSNTLHMTDGTTVLIAAALLLIISIIAFALANQTAKREREGIVDTADTVGVTPTETASPSERSVVNDETVTNNEAGTQGTAQPEIQR